MAPMPWTTHPTAPPWPAQQQNKAATPELEPPLEATEQLSDGSPASAAAGSGLQEEASPPEERGDSLRTPPTKQATLSPTGTASRTPRRRQVAAGKADSSDSGSWIAPTPPL